MSRGFQKANKCFSINRNRNIWSSFVINLKLSIKNVNTVNNVTSKTKSTFFKSRERRTFHVILSRKRLLGLSIAKLKLVSHNICPDSVLVYVHLRS